MTRQVEVTGGVSVRAARTSGRSYGPGTHEVPDDVADDLLRHRLVTPADRGDDGSDGAVDGDDGDDADSDGDGDGSDGADLIGSTFVDRSWQAVVSDLRDGKADHDLDAVEAAEQARENGARDSVMSALSDRRDGSG